MRNSTKSRIVNVLTILLCTFVACLIVVHAVECGNGTLSFSEFGWIFLHFSIIGLLILFAEKVWRGQIEIYNIVTTERIFKRTEELDFLINENNLALE